MKFLEGVAHGFFSEFREKVSDLCFVFPNRRSALFFKKYLGERVDKPLFSPYITTLRELIILLSGYREADRAELLFTLYDCYRELVPNGESFDEFLYWGEIILADFNDVDKALANPKQLFTNIKELKEISSEYDYLSERQLKAITSFWEGFLPSQGLQNKERFIKNWEILSPLYTLFNQRLETKRAGYEGALYRRVASHRGPYNELNQYREIVFIGFNALTASEKEIMKALKRAGVADFYWDYEREFIEDKINSASRFVEENLSNFPSKRDLSELISRGNKAKIKTVGIPSQVMQSQVVGELLKEFPCNEESVVVLPDESLLLPILDSIPPNIDKINITMGYPVSGTPIIAFIKQVIQLEWDERGLYFKRALPLLNHSLVYRVAEEEARSIVTKITKENKIYLTEELFERDLFIKTLFKRVELEEEPHQSLCDKLITLLEFFANHPNSTKIEREFIFNIQSAITRVKGIIIPMNFKSFARVIAMITEGITIPFTGEPLAGLQLMGLLETRTLDFSNVIICSMNEGLFPKRPSSNSYIPYNLRVGFGLPTREHEDAISSYLFYSLISRAKNVTLLYDNRTEGARGLEQSRFILQLKYLYNLIEIESVVNNIIEPSTVKEIVIDKDHKVLGKMRQLFIEDPNGGLSASALNNYIDCPLKFYFANIERLSKSEELDEGIEASEFGSIFHYVMEQLYKPLVGKELTPELFDNLIGNQELIEKQIDAAFKKIKNIDNPRGYALLIKKLIQRYLNITIRYDKATLPFRIVDLEKKIFGSVLLESGEEIRLKGFIDRVDKTKYNKIIDYKSGSGKLYYNTIESLFDSQNSNRSGVVFQMFLYAFLLSRGDDIEVEAYFLRSLAKNQSDILLLTPEKIVEFSESLEQLLSELFNEKGSFTQTQIKSKCEWCDFKSICY